MTEPGAGVGRPIGMRPPLGNLAGAALTVAVTAVTLVILGGCGSSSSSVVPDAASDPAGVPSRTPGPVEGATVLPLISMTGGGGRTEPTATRLSSKADIRAFAAQFRGPALANRMRAAIAAVPATAGHEVVGQVVMVGCDRPPSVTVVVDQNGDIVLVPGEVASPLPECLAPVTTVAIAVLPPG